MSPLPPPLYPHQKTAAERIARREPVYLGFDMGIGKTRTFIEGVKAALETRGTKRVLVICPKSAVLVWKREIRLWDPGATIVVVRRLEDLKPGPHYTIITHGTMSQRGGEIASNLHFAAPFSFTAIDEAQGFNAESNLRVKALQRAASLSRLGFIVPLSGTPMKNHAGDLYTLTRLCWPVGLGKMTRHDFEENFCIVRQIPVKTRWGTKYVRKIDGSKNIPRLRELLAPFMLRVRKEDVLTDLPPIQWDLAPVDIDPSAMPLSDLMALEAMIAKMATGPGTNSDALVRALSTSSDAHLMQLRRLLGLAKLRGACEYLVDMLDNLPEDRKVLVFGIHKDVLAALKHHLDEYDPAVITGEVTGKAREDAYQKFLTKPQCRVFLGNIQAAGTALTLVGPTCKCSDVVFVESSWTPMDNAQAACRVHRIGQRDGVVARMLTAANTVDDLIQTILVRKAGEFTQLFDTKGETA